MKFSAVRDFVAVAEQGGLRAAARLLGLAQPVITRSIQELEKELGVHVFERTAKGVRLTPIGQTFLRRAYIVSTELKTAKEEIDQLRGCAHGTVTVCMSSVPHLALLPNVLGPFRRQFPTVQLHIIDTSFPIIESKLLDGRVDVYVGPVAAKLSRELQMEKLFDNTRVIMGRKGHPLAGARSLRELADAEWITTSITSKAEEELGPLFAEHDLPPPHLAMQAQSGQTFLISMVYSDLLMMLPVQWVKFPLWRDVLQQIEVKEALPAPPIHIVRRAGMPLTPAAEYFCDMVRRAAGHMDSLT